jgi:hypothetical protein
MATLTDLGGVAEGPPPGEPSPAWLSRPWPSVALWRRLAIRHRGLLNIPWLLVLIPLAPFILVVAWICDRRARRG